jgi:hypothetical protein
MDMTKVKDEIVCKKEWRGVLSCDFKYKIASEEALLGYTGPKIPHDEWHKLMSFFRWTFETANSEAQARGYIDPVSKKLFFWAFPQEGGTGMTTHEIAGPCFDKQRSELPNAGDLEYFMTVHHHCSCSAFQSGGDKANEEQPGGGNHETGQDGLHITVGNMDKDVHSMDVRFYLNGSRMVPSMANFWDIGEEIEEMVPAEIRDKVARYQMCRKVEVAFPEKWKENYIRPQPVARTTASYLGIDHRYSGNNLREPYRSIQSRIKDSADDIVESICSNTVSEEEIDEVITSLEFLEKSDVFDAILQIAITERYDCVDLKHLILDVSDKVFEYKETIAETAVEAEEAVDKTATSEDHSLEADKKAAGLDDGRHWSQEEREWIG